MTKPFTYLVQHLPSGGWYYGVRYANGCSPDDLWSNYYTSSQRVHDLIAKDGASCFRHEIRKVFQTSEDAIKWEHRVLKRVLNSPGCLNDSAFPAVSVEARRRGNVTKAKVGSDGLTAYQRAVKTWLDKRNQINPTSGLTFEEERKQKSAKTRRSASEEVKLKRKLRAVENAKRMHAPEIRAKAHAKLRQRVIDGTFPTTKGRKFPSISEKLKGKQFTLGLIWVNDGVKNFRVKPDDPKSMSLNKGRLITTGAASKGFKQVTVVCPHCKKSGANTNMKRYHFDNCKVAIP